MASFAGGSALTTKGGTIASSVQASTVQQHPEEKSIYEKPVVCFSEHKKNHRTVWQCGLPPLRVCDTIATTALHLLRGSGELCHCHGHSAPLIWLGSCLLSFKDHFHYSMTVFPKKSVTTLWLLGNGFADGHRGKGTPPQCCSPPSSRRPLVWLSLETLPREMTKSSPGLSCFQEEARPGDDSWCQWRGSTQPGHRTLRLGPSSPPWPGGWARQSVLELAFAVLNEESTNPHFSFITSFRGPLSLNVNQVNNNKKWKTKGQMLLNNCLLL